MNLLQGQLQEQLKESLYDVDKIKKNAGLNLKGIPDAIEKGTLGMFSWVAYDREGVDPDGTPILFKDYAPAPVIMTAGHGVGKTGLGRTMAFSIGGKFVFISGQPDLSSSKIMGRDIFVGDQFYYAKGSINANIVLFDEIPKTPPKVQAPFFQAMEERQAIVDTFDKESKSVVNKRVPLTPIFEDMPDGKLFFWPIATGNPYEQEGNFELPEALWDRFSIHFGIGYPDRESEKLIDSRNFCGPDKPIIRPVITLERAHQIGHFYANNIEIGPDMVEYIERLTENSRHRERDKPELRDHASKSLKRFVDQYTRAGASPRYNFHFKAVVRTLAAFRERLYVTVDDVRDVFHLVATHRMLLNRLAVGRNIKQKDLVNEILKHTPIPPAGSKSMVSFAGLEIGPFRRFRSYVGV